MSHCTRPGRASLLVAAPMLLLLVLLAAGCGGGSDGSSAKGDGGSSSASGGGTGGGGGDCDGSPSAPGKVHGLDVVRHCGDATATITAKGTETKIEGGNCQNTSSSVVVNIGATVTDPSADPKERAKVDYLGILAGKHPAAAESVAPVDKDGTYTDDVLLTVAAGGTSYLATERSLTLTDDRTKGSFTAKSVDGDEIDGTFSCG